jgi:hypothetical protein
MSWAGVSSWGAEMLEYLEYALFVVLVIGCLIYVMNGLEDEGAPSDPKQ